MADITVDVDLPSIINVDVSSPTQAVGANVYIAGPQGPRGPGSNINGLTPDYFYITGKDGITVFSNGIDIIYVSGNSGYFQSAVTSLSNNINSLSGLFTGHTGDLNASYATDFELASTGSILNTRINNLSGYVNSQDTSISNNLFSTGYNLYSMLTGFSGNLDASYATDVQLYNTGSTLDSKVNFLSGYINSSNSNIVFTTGNQTISGIKTFDIAPFLSGSQLITGDLSLYATKINLATTGSTLDVKINSLSGNLTSTYSTITNLSLTGSALDSKINSLSGYSASVVNLQSTGSNLYSMLIGFSGNLDATYATDSQLYTTGSTLDSKINSLSGNLTSTYATISNLASTGSILDSKINSLSGYSASAINLVSTGSSLYVNINSLSGLFTGYTGTLDATYASDSQLFNTGSSLNDKITSLSGSLNSSGSNLNNSITSLSGLFTGYTGALDATFATDLQLYTTGSTLDTKINSLSGNLTSTYSTISNLASTGSALDSKINSLSGNLTSNYSTILNLASTGSTLNSNINSLSGLFTGYTGTLDATYATDLQLANTGSSLQTNINNLSGYVNANSVFLTGDQTINGNKTFVNNIQVSGTGTFNAIDLNNIDNLSLSGVDITITNSNVNVYGSLSVSGVPVLTGVDLSSYATKVNLASTGSTLDTKINSLSGNLTSNYSTISNLALTGSTLDVKINSLSGNLTSNYATITNLGSTGSALDSKINSLSGNLTSNYATIINLSLTGSTLDSKINNLSGYSASIVNLSSTGSALDNKINSLSGNLTANYATITNLASTGSTLVTNLANTGSNLDAKINALSGSAVLLYGNQTINGLKDFTTRPTVNTTPVLLSGENANGLTVLVKNDESTTLLKGQPVYIYGANGNNILVRKASNTGEAYSSKTLGLLAQDLTSNAQGLVITEGSLEGINTNAGNAGDPIWLGPTGDLIFGLAQKPYAPNHLVYLGVIERKQSNNGKIYVKVQNGFELHELHNVNINHKNVLNDNDIIRYNSASGLWFNETLNTGIFQTQINSLSGSSVLLYGNQSVGGIKTFRDNVYINNLFVTGNETIVSTNNFSVQNPYLLLNLTGGAVDGGIFFVTGSGLTGINDSGPIIGFDHSTKFKFGFSTRNSDLSTLPDIASVQDITTYSGFVDGKYSTIINLALTGSTLSTNLASTGSTLQTNINNLSNTYATIINLGLTGSTLVTNLANTGSTLDTKINNLSGVSVLTFGNQNISGIKTFNNGLATTYISGVSGSSLDIIGFSGRSVNINAGNSLVGSNAGDVTLTAGNSPTLRGSINLIAGTGGQGVGIVSPGINLYAGQSPTYDGNNNIFGNINVNKFLTFQR